MFTNQILSRPRPILVNLYRAIDTAILLEALWHPQYLSNLSDLSPTEQAVESILLKDEH